MIQSCKLSLQIVQDSAFLIVPIQLGIQATWTSKCIFIANELYEDLSVVAIHSISEYVVFSYSVDIKLCIRYQ